MGTAEFWDLGIFVVQEELWSLNINSTWNSWSLNTSNTWKIVGLEKQLIVLPCLMRDLES